GTSVDRGYPHWHDRGGSEERKPRSLELLTDRCHLIGLNVEEHQIGAPRSSGGSELLQQVVLHEIESPQQERSEPDTQDQNRGLIGRAVQVGQSLPPDVRHSLRETAPQCVGKTPGGGP